MSEIGSVLGAYLTQTPIYLIWLVGIVLAGVRWRRHPRVSLLAVVAFGILFVESFIGTFLNVRLPVILSHRLPMRNIGLIVGVSGMIRSLIRATAWGLLLVAIFGRRE